MAINLDDPNAGPARYPVMKHRVIGEVFAGMLIKSPEQRDLKKTNPVTQQLEPVPNGRGGFRKELVVTVMVLPGTTMTGGPETEPVTVQPGDVVRFILKGKAFSTWIDADKALPGRVVGDVIMANTTHGQAYDHMGNPSGAAMLTDAECNALPRGMTYGKYGDLAIRRATAEEAAWVAKAEEAHVADKPTVALDSGLPAAPAADLTGVFGAPAAAPAPQPAAAPAAGFPPPAAPVFGQPIAS